MSAPAENGPPRVPVRTTALVSSCPSTSWRAAIKSSIMACESALRFPGRFSWMVVTPLPRNLVLTKTSDAVASVEFFMIVIILAKVCGGGSSYMYTIYIARTKTRHYARIDHMLACCLIPTFGSFILRPVKAPPSYAQPLPCLLLMNGSLIRVPGQHLISSDAQRLASSLPRHTSLGRAYTHWQNLYGYAAGGKGGVSVCLFFHSSLGSSEVLPAGEVGNQHELATVRARIPGTRIS